MSLSHNQDLEVGLVSLPSELDQLLPEPARQRKLSKISVIGLVAIAIVMVFWHSKRFGSIFVLRRVSVSTVTTAAGEFGNGFEGDIITNPAQVAGAYGKKVSGAHFGVASDNIVADPVKLWPNGRVYYEITPEASHPDIILMVNQAIAHLESKVPGLKFHQRTTEKNWIRIVPNPNGCYSAVGMEGGAQPMQISATECANYTVVHEFMHALGFWHEHTRSDRDKFVKVHHENVLSPQYWGIRKNQESRGSKYDYSSLMHYPPWGGNKEFNTKLITLSAKDVPSTEYKGDPKKMGQRRFLSDEDIKQLKDLYPNTPTCRRPTACTFPFVYNDYSFSSCTTYGHTEPWCSLDATMLSGSTRWMNCASATGKDCGDTCPCVFPFTYKTTTYNKCTDVDDTRLWCSEDSEYAGKWQYCDKYFTCQK